MRFAIEIASLLVVRMEWAVAPTTAASSVTLPSPTVTSIKVMARGLISIVLFMGVFRNEDRMAET
jgi:hypothetical protein